MKFQPITITPMTPTNRPAHDHALPLGKQSTYPDRYDPALLYPIERTQARQAIGLSTQALPFIGWDLWHCYELSWLKPSAMPCTAILKLWIAANSPCIVESKSLKLYLNSLNHERFDSTHALSERIKQDLTRTVGHPVELEIVEPAGFAAQRIDEPDTAWVCLDQQDLAIEHFEPNAELLKLKDDRSVVNESIYSRLLRTNCPVTGQPDWGSVHIQYQGAAIDHAAVLRYIVSFRQHQGFHEQCVEQMFCDIMKHCSPQMLSIYARYTRRGGVDINPWRATPGVSEPRLQRSAQQ